MQEAPFTVHMEPTEGCSLACSFCGLQAVRDNGADAEKGIHGERSTPYRFMSVQLAERIASEVKRLGWNPRIEFTGRGEPTMNPALSEIISTTRKILPKSSITLTTNGSGILKVEKIKALFDSGLNTIAYDDYKHSPWRVRINQCIFDYVVLTGTACFNYPAELEANPHHRFFQKRIIIIQDISDNSSGTHILTNQAGNSFKAISQPLDKRCAKPFREFTIRWDGNVAVCCDDWRGVYKISNVNNESLDIVWNHPRFDTARRFLYAGDRASMKPCNVCNVKTFRNGLLPDKMGQEYVYPPTLQDSIVVEEATVGEPYSLKLS